LPGLNGFVGEFMILLGSWRSTAFSDLWVVLGTTGVILAAVYLLWLVYRTFFGEVTSEANLAMKDLNAREVGLMGPLAVLMVLVGFWVAPLLGVSGDAVRALRRTSELKAAAVEAAAGEAGPSAVAVPFQWPARVAEAP